MLSYWKGDRGLVGANIYCWLHGLLLPEGEFSMLQVHERVSKPLLFCQFQTRPKKAEAFRSKRLFSSFVVNAALQFTSQCKKVHEGIMPYPYCNFSIFRRDSYFSSVLESSLQSRRLAQIWHVHVRSQKK